MSPRFKRLVLFFFLPLFCVVLGTGKILDDFEKYRPVIMKGGRS